MSERFDVGLIVPLAEEMRYVLELMPVVGVIEREGERYLELDAGTGCPRVVAVQLGEMGLLRSGLAVERMLRQFAPKEIALAGIAGATTPDLMLGDVVVASQVDDYQNAMKIVDAGEDHEVRLAGLVWQAPFALLQLARNFETSSDYQEWRRTCAVWKPPIANDEAYRAIVGQAPKCLVGHVASGDAVVASTAFAERLKARDRKIIAVEMEAAGAAQAAMTRPQAVPLLVVRGISDFADGRKDGLDATRVDEPGAWRRYATLNAVALLKWLWRQAEWNPSPAGRFDSVHLSSQTRYQLEQVLAGLYSTEGALRRLLAHADVDPLRVELSGSPLVMVYSAMTAAEVEGKLAALIEAAGRDAPNNDQLRRLRGA